MLALLALPKFGLSTVFVVAFVSATLLPLGSEPAVFGLVKLNPGMFWPAVLVATAGNTLGGALTWWMGYAAERTYEHVSHHKPPHARALGWLERFGSMGCLLAWVPVVVLPPPLPRPAWPFSSAVLSSRPRTFIVIAAIGVPALASAAFLVAPPSGAPRQRLVTLITVQAPVTPPDTPES